MYQALFVPYSRAQKILQRRAFRLGLHCASVIVPRLSPAWHFFSPKTGLSGIVLYRERFLYLKANPAGFPLFWLRREPLMPYLHERPFVLHGGKNTFDKEYAISHPSYSQMQCRETKCILRWRTIRLWQEHITKKVELDVVCVERVYIDEGMHGRTKANNGQWTCSTPS